MEAVFPEPEYKLQRSRPAIPSGGCKTWSGPIRRTPATCGASNTAAARASFTAIRICRATGSSPGPANGTTIRQAVDEHIGDALAIGINVLTYATNREPKGKEQSFDTPLGEADVDGRIAPRRHRNRQAPPRRRLQRRARRTGQSAPHRVARRPEAAGSRRARPDQHLRREPVPLPSGVHARPARFPLHRRRATQLREYLERGGTLLADSICASKAFAAAFRREIAAALPGTSLQRIPADDPIFTNAFGGYDIRQVSAPRSASAPTASHRSPPASARSNRSSKASNSTAAGPSSSRPTTSAAPRKPRSHRLPRLHPARRRPHRAQRAVVLAESMTFSPRFLRESLTIGRSSCAQSRAIRLVSHLAKDVPCPRLYIRSHPGFIVLIVFIPSLVLAQAPDSRPELSPIIRRR